MYKPESVLENTMHKIHWEYEIQIDHLISARRPGFVIVNKKKRIWRILDFDHKVKIKEIKRRDKYLDLTRELKKVVEHKSNGDANCKSW